MYTLTTPTSVITPEMLDPLSEGISANVGVILPVALGIFAIFIGIRMVPKLVYVFTS